MTAILSTVTIATSANLMTADAYAGNLTAVTSIGRRTNSLGVDTSKVAAAIVDMMGESYDWTARGALPQSVHLFVCGAAKGPAVPPQKDSNLKPTNYGTGVDVLVAALKKALATEPAEKEAAMRVSLTGVGSAVVPADHPAYALLLALLGADEEGEPTA